MDSKLAEEREVLEPLNPAQEDVGVTSGQSAAVPEPGSAGRRFNVKKVESPVSPPPEVAPGPDSVSVSVSVAGQGAGDEEGKEGKPVAVRVDRENNNGASPVEIEMSDIRTNPKARDNSLAHKDNLPLADNEDSLYGNHMALYEDDLSNAGKISQILNRITSYQAGMAPNVSDVEKEKQKPKAMLGTVLGVY
ncbi:uncharacterized protein LOC106011279, partial [Aplysia californica]|uniref:Uncharacterized protein LOC106011279 n=1 Tax=Aplysia californica TaxID=6500 RepID=A0ABM0ZW95_APLCA